MEIPDVKVGDWVRFYSNGVLVIGQVEYIYKDLWTRICTDKGMISPDSIREVRRPNEVQE